MKFDIGGIHEYLINYWILNATKFQGFASRLILGKIATAGNISIKANLNDAASKVCNPENCL